MIMISLKCEEKRGTEIISRFRENNDMDRLTVLRSVMSCHMISSDSR